MNWRDDYVPDETELRAEGYAGAVLMVAGVAVVAGVVAVVGWLVWRVIGG